MQLFKYSNYIRVVLFKSYLPLIFNVKNDALSMQESTSQFRQVKIYKEIDSIFKNGYV